MKYLLKGAVRSALPPGVKDNMPIREFLGSYGTACDLPPIAGTYKGKQVIILGDAACVWDDLARFGCVDRQGRGKVWKSGWHFCAINKMVETFPGDLEHAYSNNPNDLNTFIAARRPEYRREFNMPQETHSITKGVKWTWPWGGHGSSGLGALLTMLACGYDHVVLAGLPLDNSAHNGEPPWRTTCFESSECAGPIGGGMDGHWKTAKETACEDKVRSLSGRTRDWFGAPNP